MLKEKKGLGEVSDSDDDDANAWVERMRKMEEEKKRAEERVRQFIFLNANFWVQAKMFNEMDEEFDVSGVIEAQKAKLKKKPAGQNSRRVWHFRLAEYVGGATVWIMDKERVGIGLDRLNLVSKCATRRADHFDAKFIITNPSPTLSVSIFTN